jgi:hypothetical protein
MQTSTGHMAQCRAIELTGQLCLLQSARESPALNAEEVYSCTSCVHVVIIFIILLYRKYGGDLIRPNLISL